MSDSDPLTRREREILRLMAEGHSNREVAEILWKTDEPPPALLATMKSAQANTHRKLDRGASAAALPIASCGSDTPGRRAALNRGTTCTVLDQPVKQQVQKLWFSPRAASTLWESWLCKLRRIAPRCPGTVRCADAL
jgi:Bacterial regulatory proteins, luxR family